MCAVQVGVANHSYLRLEWYSQVHMNLSGKLVQVARPTQENSLVQGMVGIAWSVRDMGDDLPNNASIPDLYLLEPEGFDEQENVAGLLFTEEELEPIP